MNSKILLKTTLIFATMVVLVTGFLQPHPVNAMDLPLEITTSMDSTEKSGIPGSLVIYTLTLKNVNTDGDLVSLSITGSSIQGWDLSIENPLVDLGPGETRKVKVIVTVPSTVTVGMNDIATITITDSTPEGVKKYSLTTTAASPSVSGRPIVAISSYSSTPNPIKPYQEFTLSVVFENRGQSTAQNVIVTFEGTDVFPRSNGGVSTISSLGAGDKTTFTQTFLAGGNLTWQEVASIKATAVYSDGSGQAYTEPFNLTLGITAPVYYASTATPKAQTKPRLVITGIETDVDPIQPGSIFNLKLSISNLGKVDAKGVTMVLGGGVTPPDQTGTQQPGGLSGSSGDLTNFAPLGSSNVLYIGDIQQEGTITTTQKLVTNVSTQPGAYTLKVSFVYDDGKGSQLVDDQVITLLVYSLPQVEIGFYRDPGEFTVGMPNTLPIQVTNLGKKTNVLGNMKVTVDNADLTNDVSLVGALDPGGYYTLDTEITPMQEGNLDVIVTINYTDDFNQPRFVTSTINIDVLPAPEFTDGLEGQDGSGMSPLPPTDNVPETFWSKLARFFKGLFGLGSGTKQTPTDSLETVPTEQFYPSRPGKGG